MTVLLEKTTESETVDDTVRYASWPARATAIALDYLPGVAIIVTMALLAFSTPRGGVLWWVFTGVAAATGVAMVVNRIVLPPVIGWTMGRAVCGIRVTGTDGETASSLRLLGRGLAHVLDTVALFIGWLWPLWDERNRTFADLLLRTQARAVEAPRRDVRRLAGLMLVAAALLCAAGTALGYLEVYRPDRAVEQARAEITEQGPRIVEQLLSYGAKSVTDDFTRAQTLVTDDYRPQLTALQQGVRKAGVTNNEYWAVSSAVLSATGDKAAMLLALQGQRGIDQAELRFITATVRADFVKSGDEWQVSALTVLKRPASNGVAPAPAGQLPGEPPAPGRPLAPGQPAGTGR